MKYSRITGTGSYLPEKVLTNHDLEKIMDTSDEWIRDRTGIYKRHIAAGDETTCDLAEIAATRAMEAAGRTPRQVDLIVLATTTPDRVFPSTACLLQQRLDIHGTAAFDVQAVCTGFVYALGIADKFIKTGAHGLHVERGGTVHIEALLQQAGGAGKDTVRGRGRDDNEIDLARCLAGSLHRLGRRNFCQVTGRFITGGNMPLVDSGPVTNPFVRGIHDLFQIMVGQGLLGQIAAGTDDS